MASQPNSIKKFKSLESDLSTSIAQALWLKAAQVCDYINLSYPVGMLMFFNASQSNVPSLPDSKYWQFADGSVVTNANSPLLGQTLPDFRNKFIKHPATGQVTLVQAGNNSFVVNHSHGGATGIGSDWDSLRMDNGSSRGQALGAHQHAIANTPITVQCVPAHLQVQVYVRIV